MRRLLRIVLLLTLLAVTDAAGAQVYDSEPPDSRIVAGRRAAEVVLQDLDELLDRYPEAREFPYAAGAPFGAIHADAPVATEQFGQLAGLWYIEQHSYFEEQWYCCWNATWGFRYVIDGFAVQDLWVQQPSDLPPTSQLDRTFALTQLRVYRPGTDDWFIAYVTGAGDSGGRNNGMFVARQAGDEIVMLRDNDPGYAGRPDRVVFFGIEANRWRWRRDVQNDSGQWRTVGFIDARRLPWPRRE